MYVKVSCSIFAVISVILCSSYALAGAECSLDAKLGIGALGRIEPRSRVIKISHNAGPEGARVEQIFFQETDQVKAGDTLAILSDHLKKKAQVEAARARIKVLEAQRAVEHKPRSLSINGNTCVINHWNIAPLPVFRWPMPNGWRLNNLEFI